MPTYEVTGPSGTVIEMEGANPPSQSDIDAAFASIQQTASPAAPASSGGADLARMASAAYNAPAPNIGANLNLRDARAAGGQTLSLSQASPIARERAYDVLGGLTGQGGSEAARFTKEFRAAPVGQAFQDRDLGAIVKTGDNTFRRVGQAPQREQTAGDISSQLLNQVSNADIGGALSTLQPGFNRAGNLAVRSGGLVASTLAPELRLPGLILGSTGELAGEAIDAESAGQDPLNWRNYSLPGIVGAGLVSTVGSGATAPTLRQAAAQGILEGGALEAPYQLSSLTAGPTQAEIDPNTGLPIGAAKYEGNATDLLPTLAMGLGARGGHAIANAISDLRNPRLPQIESAPASYTDQGIVNAQTARQAEGNAALADAFQGEQRALHGIDTGYQNAVELQAPVQAQNVLDAAEAQGAVNAQRQGAILDNPATPQSAQALREQLALEQQAADRAVQQQNILRQASGLDLQEAMRANQIQPSTLTPIETSPQELAARQIRELDAQRATALPLNAELSAQANRMNEQYGRALPIALPTIAGAGVGGAIGATQGDTPQERLQNTLIGAAGGGLLGAGGTAAAARLAQPELNAGEQVLAKAAKPPSLANVVAETASHVEGSPASTQAAANALTQTPKLPTIAEATAQQSAVSSLKDKLVSGLKKAGKALTQGDTVPKFEGDYAATPDAVKGGPAPVGSYSGVQEGANGEKIDLFHLNQPVYDDAGKMVHPAGSDVSRESLEKLGYTVPEPSTLPPTKGAYPSDMTGEEFNRLRQQDQLGGNQNAIQKQSATSEVLRPESTGQSGKLELPSVEPRNAQSEIVAGTQALDQAIHNIEQAPPLKPLPEDTEFLYEQKYNGRNGPVRERYYQVDRTPDNPRGRTVDEATLRSEGYDTSGLPGPEENPANSGSSQFSGAIGAGGTQGAVTGKALGILAGGATGGTLGFLGSNEKDDKLVHTVAGAIIGGISAAALMKGADAITRAKVGQELDVLRRNIINENIPRLRNASEESANAVFRYANAPQAAEDVAKDMQARVLGSQYKSPEFSKKLGSVWVEEQQRGLKNSLEEAANNAATPEEAAQLRKQASKVVSTIGRESVFKNEAEFQAALNDPQIKQANEIFKQTVQPAAEARHLLTGGFDSREEYEAAIQEALKNGDPLPTVKLAAPGPNTGVFINQQPIFEEAKEVTSGSSPKGNLRNPLQRRSAFSKVRKGTAEEYNIDANSLIERMVKGNYEDAAKRNMFSQLEKDGLGVALPAGERPADLDTGRYGGSIPIEQRGSGSENIQFWPDKSIERELRTALNTDGPLSKAGIAHQLRGAMNLIQMRGLTDPVVHGANIIAGIASAPGGESFLTQVFRGMPIASSFDALGKVGMKVVDLIKDTPEIRSQIAKLSEIGSIRPVYEGEANRISRFLHTVDKAGRLALDDLYQTLVDRGLVQESEAGRRDFTNRIGQYNSRLLGKYDAILKESGLSPFLVAGKNFNSIGLKQVGALGGLSTGGVKAASKAASLQLRAAQTIGAYSTLVAIPAVINYLAWGDPGGPEGTPLGKIALNESDDGKRYYFDPAQLTLLRRGLRSTGLQAVITGAQTGDNLNNVGGQAWRDVRNALIHPYAGPVPTAAVTALTGYNPTFHRVAENVTPIGQSPDTLRQLGANASAAFRNLNPVQGAFAESATPKAGEEAFGPGESILPGAGNMLMDLAGAGGLRRATPLSEDTGALHEAQDERFEANRNRKKFIESIIAGSTDANGQLDLSQVRAHIQTPEIQQAIRENPLQAQLLKNEIRTAVKQKLQGQQKSDVEGKFNVAEGERAQFYLNRISNLSPEGAQQYLRDQKSKGYLTRKVLQQMNYLRSRQPTGVP